MGDVELVLLIRQVIEILLQELMDQVIKKRWIDGDSDEADTGASIGAGADTGGEGEEVKSMISRCAAIDDDDTATEDDDTAATEDDTGFDELGDADGNSKPDQLP